MQDVHRHDQRTSLLLRRDTIFGVCAGVGEDFGFNPNWIRVVLALIVIWNPAIAVGSYVVLGAAVLFSRLLAPDVRVADAAADQRTAAPLPARANDDRSPEAVSIAA